MPEPSIILDWKFNICLLPYCKYISIAKLQFLDVSDMAGFGFYYRQAYYIIILLRIA